MKIPVGISNRHIHLSEEVKKKVLGDNFSLKIKRNLTQSGEFASETKLTIKTRFGKIEDIRVVGPIRKYTQVEILKSDEETLGISAPFRNSGYLESSASLIIEGPLGETELDNCCIVANRHIHMNEKDAIKYNVKDKEIVRIKAKNNILDNVNIKIDSSYVLECHLDKDDELKYDIHNGDEIEILREVNNE